MSVLTIAADFALANIVEAMLPRGGSLLENRQFERAGDPLRALYISVRITLHVFSEEDGDEDDREHREAHLIFCWPSNYTKVWSTVSADARIRVKPEMFVMRSDHDSCWRTDGMRDLTEAYFDALGKLRDRHPGAKIHEFNTIDTIEWRTITWKVDPSDRYNHRKLLASIERMKA